MKLAPASATTKLFFFVFLVVIVIMIGGAWHILRVTDAVYKASGTKSPIASMPPTVTETSTHSPIPHRTIPLTLVRKNTTTGPLQYQLTLPSDVKLKSLAFRLVIESNTKEGSTKSFSLSEDFKTSGWQTAVNSVSTVDNKTTIDVALLNLKPQPAVANPVIGTITLSSEMPASTPTITLDASKSQAFTSDGETLDFALVKAITR